MSDQLDQRNVVSRIVRGFAANGFGQVVTFLSSFVSVPLFLHFWGRSLYGEWLILGGIPTFLSVSDLSFGTTAGSEMTMLAGRGDRRQALAVLQSVWLFVTVVSLVILVLMVVLSAVLPLPEMLNLSLMSQRESFSVLTLLLMGVCLAQQGGLVDAVAKAAGLFPTCVMVLNLMRLAEFLLGVWVLVSGGDPWLFAWTLIVPKLVVYTWLWVWYSKTVPWLYLGWSHASKATLKPLVVPALVFNAFNLGYAFSLQGMVILVGKLTVPAEAAIFGPLRTLSRVVLQGATAIANSVWVELSRAFGAGDVALARRIHRRASQIGFWLVAPCLLVLVFLGQPLFQFWTHGLRFDAPLFLTLLLVTLMGSLWGISYVVPLSVNRHHTTAATFLATSALSVVLSVLLMPPLGLLGIGVGLAVGEFVMLVFVWRRAMVLLEEDFGAFLGQMLTPPLDLAARVLARGRNKSGRSGDDA